MCTQVWCPGILRSQVPLELELQAVASHPECVLGMELQKQSVLLTVEPSLQLLSLLFLPAPNLLLLWEPAKRLTLWVCGGCFFTKGSFSRVELAALSVV